MFDWLFGKSRRNHVTPAPAKGGPSGEARPMQSIEKLIQNLQQVQKQKGMFVFPLDLPSFENFLNGFRAAASACGCEIPRKLRQEVLTARGWKFAAAGPAPQMKAKGMADDAIMNELLEIEIDLLGKLAKLPPKKP
jgi:hypothetical protein